MGDSLERLYFWLKRGLAIVLFVGLLVGASATAFYALAAGISAMSGFAGRTVVEAPSTFIQPAVSVGSTQPVVNGQTIASSSTTTPSVPASPASTSSGGGQSVGGQSGNGSDPGPPIQSTVGEAIDGGGFAIGLQVQKVFGSVLGGVLNTLFLDQPVTSNGSGGSGGQTN